MWAAFSGEMSEGALGADDAGGVGFGGADLASFVGPEVEGEEGPADETGLAGKEFEGFGDLDGGGEVNGGGENAGGVAGFDGAGGRLGEEAGEAGGRILGWGGDDGHGRGIGTDGGGVDPGFGLLDGVVVDEVAGLEVVGGVEDDVGGGEEFVNVCGDEVGDVGMDGDGGVEEGDLAAGGLGLGKRLEGVGFVEEDLTLEVGGLDEVSVDEGEGADAGAGEQRGCGCSGGSAADDGDVGCGEHLLAGGADSWEEDLTRIAVVGGDLGGGGGEL